MHVNLFYHVAYQKGYLLLADIVDLQGALENVDLFERKLKQLLF